MPPKLKTGYYSYFESGARGFKFWLLTRLSSMRLFVVFLSPCWQTPRQCL